MLWLHQHQPRYMATYSHLMGGIGLTRGQVRFIHVFSRVTWAGSVAWL